jgi:hypothetical protein
MLLDKFLNLYISSSSHIVMSSLFDRKKNISLTNSPLNLHIKLSWSFFRHFLVSDFHRISFSFYLFLTVFDMRNDDFKTCDYLKRRLSRHQMTKNWQENFSNIILFESNQSSLRVLFAISWLISSLHFPRFLFILTQTVYKITWKGLKNYL